MFKSFLFDFFFWLQVLPDNEYNHFLKLFIAVRLCSSNTYKQYHFLASKLFNLYVKEYEYIYGRNAIGSNVHNLIHVVEDMQFCNVGNLIDISTYKFENTLRLIGLRMKHSNRPLEQVVCRLIEKDKVQSDFKFNVMQSTHFTPNFFREFKHENRLLYKKIEIKPGVILSNGKSNCNDAWFMTTTDDIVKFEYADKCSELLYGFKIKEKNAFFEHPVKSTKIGIYQCSEQLESTLKSFSIDNIQAKMMRISYKTEIIFIPLAHSLDSFQ